MSVKVIKTEADYEAALVRIEALMDAEPGTPEEQELDVQALLVETYEKEHYPIGMPDPIEAIEFFMDQKGLTNADMVKYLGSPSRVSEILNGKRPLSKAMICNLVEGLGIPAEILLKTRCTTPAVEYAPISQEYQRVTKTSGLEGFNLFDETACLPVYSYSATEEYSLAA